VLEPDEYSADRELVRVRRSEIAERIRAQHQLSVLAGAAAAAGATVVAAKKDISPWMGLGFSVLFLSLGFAMLNNDQLIASGIRFIINRGGPDGRAEQAWEDHLWDERTATLSARTLVKFLGAPSNYAIPVIGAVASAVAFVSHPDAEEAWVALPAVLGLLFAASAIANARLFRSLGRPPQERGDPKQGDQRADSPPREKANGDE